MTSGELIELIRQGMMFAAGSSLAGDEMVRAVGELLQSYAAPDFVTVMHSEQAVQEYEGVKGFREGMADWMEPYAEFRFEIEDAIVEDEKLVFLVRQVGTTKHGGVEVGTESGAVWWIREGQVRQAVFYLDRATALSAAGIDPDRDAAD
jgi:ketosteroid isomerase-like protein